MARVITITLTDIGNNRYEVYRNRVPLLVGSADLDYAKDQIRRLRNPDERVELVELDGYRSDITHEFARRSRTRT